jgi:hypothetical protein
MAKMATGAKVAKKTTTVTTKTIRVRHTATEEPQQFLGLCMTCVHADGCAFRRDVSQAVLECDEFDMGPGPKSVIEVPSVSAVKVGGQDTAFKGLCVNCDVRNECKLPRPEEGVWHCEEYV